MSVDAPAPLWVATALFVLSLPVWGIGWFLVGYAIGDSYPHWSGPPPTGPPRAVKVAPMLLTSYPLVVAALGVGAFVCWAGDARLGADILILIFAAAPCLLLRGVFYHYGRMIHQMHASQKRDQ